MPIADVHTHLDIFPKADILHVIRRAEAAGVSAIINNGVNPKTNRLTLELAKKYPVVKAALGIYPIDGLAMTDEEIDSELRFIEKNKDIIVGIGEVGIDYLKTEDRVRQKVVFQKQIDLAMKIQKPLIVHSRKAESNTIEMLISAGAKKVVMHCCMADMQTVKKAQDAGFMFSIPCLIKSSSHFKKVVENLPMSRILTETDAPFLHYDRSRKSEPALIPETIAEIARIKGLTPVDCANIIYQNYQSLFS